MEPRRGSSYSQCHTEDGLSGSGWSFWFPGTAKSSQEQPGAARGSQAQPGAARSSQEQPEEPLVARDRKMQSLITAFSSILLVFGDRHFLRNSGPGSSQGQPEEQLVARDRKMQSSILILYWIARFWLQEQPKGAGASQEQPGQPGTARGSQEQPGAARGSQGQPGVARSSQKSYWLSGTEKCKVAY